MPPVVLLADPDIESQSRLGRLLQGLGLDVVAVTKGAEAIEQVHARSPILAVIDHGMPDVSGVHLLRQLRRNGNQIPIVMVIQDLDVRTAVEATRAGATDVVAKDAGPEELTAALRAAVEMAQQRPLSGRVDEPGERDRIQFFKQYEQLFRRSGKMRVIEQIVVGVADTSATVLIQGETGVGKELVAKALHYLSDRSARPFLKVNCASLPADLLESELFGHEKGAFTGAAYLKPGRFELASGGTLLLDEIGEMPLTLQSKILHVLQDSEFYRVGGREVISVDVRVIAATNKDIQTMIAEGAFRDDLYYRLNVVNIVVPPLRERIEEIPSLVSFYRDRFIQQFNRRTPDLSDDTLALMMRYSWPGNVRELENLVKRYVALGDEAHLRAELEVRMRVAGRRSRGPVLAEPAAPAEPGPPPPVDVRVGLREIGRRAAAQAEAAALRQVLDQVQWNRAKAARLLKISYKTLLAKLHDAGFGYKRERRAGPNRADGRA